MENRNEREEKLYDTVITRFATEHPGEDLNTDTLDRIWFNLCSILNTEGIEAAETYVNSEHLFCPQQEP